MEGTMSAFYLPRHVTQRNPADPLAMSHCWAACGAWMLDAATDGASRVSAREFAKAAGGGSGRNTGSGTQEDICNGLNHYGVSSALLRIPVADARALLMTERRAVYALATAYELWPVGKDCLRTEAGPDVNHEVGVIGGDPPNIMNPLCLDYQSIPLGTLIDAAARYAKENGHSRTLEIVRVYRQKPAGLIADKLRIADLEDQIAAQADWIAQARALFSEGNALGSQR
jgi:hypothetical protein